MALTQQPLLRADASSLDQELADLQVAVARARQNRWHGGDVLDPEFESVLAMLTQPRPPVIGHDHEVTIAAQPVRRNVWREVLDPAM